MKRVQNLRYLLEYENFYKIFHMKYFLETKIPYSRNKVQFKEAKMFVLKAKINGFLSTVVLLHSDQKIVSKFITLAIILYGHWLNLWTPIFQKVNFARIFWSKAYNSLCEKNIPTSSYSCLARFLYQLGTTYIRDIFKTGKPEYIVDIRQFGQCDYMSMGFFSDQTIYLCMY